MDQEIKATLEGGGRVIVRHRSRKNGITFDTELCSRPLGLMAIAKAEKAGEIRVKRTTDTHKARLVEYELAPSEPKPSLCCQGWGRHDITCAKYGQLKD